MNLSHFGISDDKAQELGFRFSSKVQGHKLIIKTYDKNNAYKYICEINEDSMVNFNGVIKLLGEGKLTIQSKDETHLSIKLGRINIEFKRQNQPENIIKNDQHERISHHEERIKLVENHTNIHSEKLQKGENRTKQLEDRILEQQDKLLNQEGLLQKAFKEIRDLRQCIEQQSRDIQELKSTLNKKKIDEQIISKKVNEINSQINENNETLTMQIIQINELKEVIDQLSSEFENKLKKVEQMKKIQVESINKQIAEIKQQLNKNDKQLTDQNQKIKEIYENSVFANETKYQKTSIKDINVNKAITNNIPFPINKIQLPNYQKQPVKNCTKQYDKNISNYFQNFLQKQLNEVSNKKVKQSNSTKRKIEWSKQFKSERAKIDKNVLTIQNENRKWDIINFSKQHYAFINLDLSIKKQQWEIKINSLNNFNIYFGIWSNNFKKQISQLSIDYASYEFRFFNTKRIKTDRQSRLRWENDGKIYEIDVGDVIYMDYDSIEWKLRLGLNNQYQGISISTQPLPKDCSYSPYVYLINSDQWSYQNNKNQAQLKIIQK